MTIKTLGVKNVLLFDLMSVPTMQAHLYGLESFYALGVLDREAELSVLGKEMKSAKQIFVNSMALQRALDVRKHLLDF
ncbi:hypothetical protein ACHAW6_011793 [Cyclotella cf. meneghiniana]